MCLLINRKILLNSNIYNSYFDLFYINWAVDFSIHFIKFVFVVLIRELHVCYSYSCISFCFIVFLFVLDIFLILWFNPFLFLWVIGSGENFWLFHSIHLVHWLIIRFLQVLGLITNEEGRLIFSLAEQHILRIMIVWQTFLIKFIF